MAAAAACRGQSAFPRTGGTLRVQWIPSGTSLLNRPDVADLVGDSLAEVSANLDEKAGVYTLRGNVWFHDGVRLTPALAAELVTKLTGLDVRESKESVRVPANDHHLIASAPLVRLADNGLVLGTGAYRIAEWNPAGKLTLAAYLAHWGGRPYLDTVEVTQAATGFNADIVELAGTQSARAMPESYRLVTSSPATLVCLVYSDAAGPVQQALSLAVDRESLARVLLQRRAEPAGALLPHWLTGYANMFAVERDVARASSLIADLRLMPLTLAYPANDPVMRAIAERVAVNARDAGVLLRPTAAELGPLQLRRLPVVSSEPHTALRAMAGALSLAARLPPAFPSYQAIVDGERMLLEAGRVTPLVHLSRAFAIASRVRVRKRLPDGDLSLADVWLEP